MYFLLALVKKAGQRVVGVFTVYCFQRVQNMCS